MIAEKLWRRIWHEISAVDLTKPHENCIVIVYRFGYGDNFQIEVNDRNGNIVAGLYYKDIQSVYAKIQQLNAKEDYWIHPIVQTAMWSELDGVEYD